MRRRHFFGGVAGALMAGRALAEDCGCAEYPLLAQNTKPEPERQSRRAAGASPQTSPWQAGQYDRVLSKVRITGLKVFGVSLTPQSDRPYVFVKLETNVGVVGWGEATLEGKAGAARFADEIGADGYAPDAASAVDVARSLAGA